jgi:hypothetical protein
MHVIDGAKISAAPDEHEAHVQPLCEAGENVQQRRLRQGAPARLKKTTLNSFSSTSVALFDSAPPHHIALCAGDRVLGPLGHRKLVKRESPWFAVLPGKIGLTVNKKRTDYGANPAI